MIYPETLLILLLAATLAPAQTPAQTPAQNPARITTQIPSPDPNPIPATTTAPPTGFTQVIPLWPAGAPLAHGNAEGDIPKLFTYPSPGPGPHPAVLVMPGGGYTHVVVGKEGEVEARWLAARGVSAFVLEYRLAPAYTFPAPMLDASRAIRYLRAHAATLGLDPTRLGVWGFSAGGHLSGYLATIHTPGSPTAADPLDRLSDRPDFAILAYARLDLDPAIPGTIGDNLTAPLQPLLGPHPTQAAIDAVDPVQHVTSDTPPTFLYSTSGDATVSSLNAALFYAALKRANVPAELHIFERGPHGTGMADMQAQHLAPSLGELAIWPTLLAHWLQQNNWMPPTP